MKYDLGMKYSPCDMPMDMDKEEEKEHYPTLRIELDENNIDLLNALKKEGNAKISFKVRSKESIEDDSPRKGSLILDIQSIEIGKEKPEMLKDSEEALNDFMQNK